MKVGIIRSVADIGHGGIFQYERAFLSALGESIPQIDANLVYLTYLKDDLKTLSRSGGLSYAGLSVEFLTASAEPQGTVDSFLSPPRTLPPIDPDHVYYDRKGADSLKAAGVDLIVQVSPSAYTFSLRLPFVMPIFDLNHRLQPHFPEVSAFGEYHAREYFYINVCRFATLVLVDSEVGKADVLRYYGDHITEDRIRVLPYYPPIVRGPSPSADECARLTTAYGLPQRYLFYPAQFWQHKNHALIIRALKILAEQGVDIPIVLTGSYADYHRAGNFKAVMALGAELGVADRIHYLGSVPERDMPALYARSSGLVMPTFFGPTNIPPFEAWHYSRPVICSDIPGIREQIGVAGLLVDPTSPEDLARAMLTLWSDPARVATLVDAGRQRLAAYSWTTYVSGVSAAVSDACRRVTDGRTPAFPRVDMP